MVHVPHVLPFEPSARSVQLRIGEILGVEWELEHAAGFEDESVHQGGDFAAFEGLKAVVSDQNMEVGYERTYKANFRKHSTQIRQLISSHWKSNFRS